MRCSRQLVATHGNGFRLSEPFVGVVAFATGCGRLAPETLHRVLSSGGPMGRCLTPSGRDQARSTNSSISSERAAAKLFVSCDDAKAALLEDALRRDIVVGNACVERSRRINSQERVEGAGRDPSRRAGPADPVRDLSRSRDRPTTQSFRRLRRRRRRLWQSRFRRLLAETSGARMRPGPCDQVP